MMLILEGLATVGSSPSQVTRKNLSEIGKVFCFIILPLLLVVSSLSSSIFIIPNENVTF